MESEMGRCIVCGTPTMMWSSDSFGETDDACEYYVCSKKCTHRAYKMRMRRCNDGVGAELHCRSEGERELLQTHALAEPSKGRALGSSEKTVMEAALKRAFPAAGGNIETVLREQSAFPAIAAAKLSAMQTDDDALRAAERILSANATLLLRAATIEPRGSLVLQDAGERPVVECILVYGKKFFGKKKITVHTYVHGEDTAPALPTRLLRSDIRNDPVVWILRALFRAHLFYALPELAWYSEYARGYAPHVLLRRLLGARPGDAGAQVFKDQLIQRWLGSAARTVSGTTAAGLTELYGMSVTVERIHVAAIFELPGLVPESCARPASTFVDHTTILSTTMIAADAVLERLGLEIAAKAGEARAFADMTTLRSGHTGLLDACPAAEAAWDAYLAAGKPCTYEVARPRLPEADGQLFLVVDTKRIAWARWQDLCAAFGIIEDDHIALARLATVVTGMPVWMAPYCVLTDSQAQRLFKKVGVVMSAATPGRLKDPDPELCRCALPPRALPVLPPRERSPSPLRKPVPERPPPKRPEPKAAEGVKPDAPVVPAPPELAPPPPPLPPLPARSPSPLLAEIERGKTLKKTEKAAVPPRSSSPLADAMDAAMRKRRGSIEGKEEEGETEWDPEAAAIGSNSLFLAVGAYVCASGTFS